MIVDAHHHLWQVARGDYGWLTPDLPICRDYGLDDLRPELGEITATVLVQAAPTEAETDFLLAVAAGSQGLVRGVVGWMDLAAPDAASRIAARKPAPLLKGLRPMLQDIADRNWIIRPAVQPALAAMAQAGLRLDVLAKPIHLPLLTTVAARHPDLGCVLDHAGKPEIATGQYVAWAHDISVIARETDWCCKLSGLVTEARALVDGGAREITLLGQNVNAWAGGDARGRAVDGVILRDRYHQVIGRRAGIVVIATRRRGAAGRAQTRDGPAQTESAGP